MLVEGKERGLEVEVLHGTLDYWIECGTELVETLEEGQSDACQFHHGRSDAV